MEWLDLADGLGAFGVAVVLIWALVGDEPRLMTRGHHKQVVDLLMDQNRDLMTELERHRETLWRAIRASGWDDQESQATWRQSDPGSLRRSARAPEPRS